MYYLLFVCQMQNTKQPFTTNIDKDTLENPNYRKVVYTGKMQLVLMSLKPSEEIGLEVHDSHDQFFRIEQGEAKAIVDDLEFKLKKDDVIIIPAGAKHNIINTGESDLKVYTIYSPAHHPEGTLQAEKPTE